MLRASNTSHDTLDTSWNSRTLYGFPSRIRAAACKGGETSTLKRCLTLRKWQFFKKKVDVSRDKVQNAKSFACYERWNFFFKHKYLSITLDNFACIYVCIYIYIYMYIYIYIFHEQTYTFHVSNCMIFILLQVSQKRCRTKQGGSAKIHRVHLMVIKKCRHWKIQKVLQFQI